MITKNNLFTVNKWIFKTPKSILYKKTSFTIEAMPYFVIIFSLSK